MGVRHVVVPLLVAPFLFTGIAGEKSCRGERWQKECPLHAVKVRVVKALAVNR